MAVRRVLTDGMTSVSLTDITAIHRTRGSFQGARIRQEELEDRAEVGGMMVELHRLNVAGQDVDEVAATGQALVTLLRKAYLNSARRSKVFRPVWLEEQADDEVSPRYALVHRVAGLDLPDLLADPFRALAYIEGMGLSIVREHPWRSAPPGSQPGWLTLDAAGEITAPTEAFVANHWDEVPLLSHVYHYDQSLATFSDNLLGRFGVGLFPAAPAASDLLMFGFDRPGHHIAIPVATPANWAVTLAIQYWNGAWVDATTGTKATWLPGGSINNLFNAAGWWVINVGNLADWTAVASGPGAAFTKYWIAVKIVTFTSSAQIPVLSATEGIHEVHEPHLDVPAAALQGDAPALSLLRLRQPYGGSTSPVFSTPSRVIIGVKEAPADGFRSHINLGGYGNPAAITVANLIADTTTVAQPTYPSGYMGQTTFATDATEQARFRVTLTNLLAAYSGVYQLYVRAGAISGTAGTVSIRARLRVGGLTSEYPTRVTPAVTLQGMDQGIEVVDLGRVELPFSQLDVDDPLGANLYVELLAKRVSGAAQLRWADVILMPVTDPWATQLDDPLADTLYGSSALRGDTQLDVDAGVIRRRCLKTLATVPASPIPAETWKCTSFPDKFEPGRRYRLYFLTMHHPTVYGTPPLVGTLGAALSAKLTAHHRYQALRFTPDATVLEPPTGDLKLWLRSDDLVLNDGDPVATWADRSGNGNNATQAVAGQRPIYKEDVLNGLPAVRFDATDDGLATPLVLALPFTIYVVYNRRGGVAWRRALQGSTDWLVGPFGGSHQYYNGALVVGPAVVQYQFVYATVRCATTINQLFVNGVYYGINTNNGAPGTLYLGRGGATADVLDGDIVEVLAYSTRHGRGDQARVQAYLAARNAL